MTNPKEKEWEEEIRVGAGWTQDGKLMLAKVREIVAAAEERGYEKGQDSTIAADSLERDTVYYEAGQRDLLTSLLAEMPKERGRAEGEDNEWRIHYMGYDEAMRAIKQLLTKKLESL